MLTAAHCCKYTDAKQYSLTVGEHKVSERNEDGERTVGASKVIIHPYYDSSTMDNDFCLLQLRSKLQFNDAVYPVCLPVSCNEECEYSNSQGNQDYVMISGWGATQEEGSGSNTLQKARVPIQNRATCSRNYANENVITDRMTCAGYSSGGIDACQGDSGGPMVCPKWGFFQQDGVTSFGLGCARRRFFGVYARVCTALDWIDYMIEMYK